MLMSRIVVDLPSAETDRKKTVFEWVRSLFGAKLDLRSGKEELTVGALALVQALAEGFASTGVTDAISFLVDRHVVYMDHDELANDIDRIVALSTTAGVLDKPFDEMHLVLAHRSSILHTLFDCRITRSVIVGQAELTIAVSSRLLELHIRPGETAKAYADRVETFAKRDGSFEPARDELEALLNSVAKSLKRVFVGAQIAFEPATVRLVRPDKAQIGRFGQLGFGDRAKPPSYRSVPTSHRSGAYADPFYYYYYDPYYDYLSYCIVNSMIHEAAWHSPHVHVVDPQGTHLFTGDHAPSATDSASSWSGQDAVRFDESGALEVDKSCEAAAASPTWSDAQPGSGADSSDSPSSWTDQSSGGDDQTRGSSCSSVPDSTSSCSSTSSCGSSCSTSSCGSSCSSSD